ncbi:flagellar filament capping protein FliD [Bacillus tuaregi]|uniref:flagellar filament capping protein FliD n=1 Tax=Bacillus tuaregi TaxID=1816695 RepID=UPI000A06D428|nr:flagellar filament capping protein FliD [Bacillus tuaregi]
MVRISGLASGMDIDSIVADMMKIKRMPLDKLKQQKQTMEWQRDDYREMNTLLLNFRSELTQMKLSTRYRTRTTTTTDDSRVTATASSAAALSSYSISNVKQLASAETRINTGSISKTGKSFEANKSMFSQMDALDAETFTWNTGAVSSKTIDVKTANNTFKLEDDTAKTSSISTWSVRVNGIGYKVVASDSNDLKLNENEVQIKTTGEMVFGKTLAANSTVKVDYVANNRTDKISISSDSATIKLSKGAINNIVDNKITLKTINDGVEAEPIILQISNEVNDKGLYTIKNGDDTVGKLNKETGEITLEGKMPRPDKNSKTTMSLEVTYDHNYKAFSIDTHTSKGERHDFFLISASDSLNSVINQVNTSSVGVNMFFDSVTGRMTMTRNETGDFNSDENKSDISFTGTFMNDVLKFRNSETVVKGQNAKFTINGLETERDSNTFAINGVTFTLKQTFNETEDKTAPPVTIAINNNNDAIFENIKGFIDKYNELIGKIQEKTQQERYKSYTPLTDEQREQLSDKQQEQWEEKAKSGLLRRDQTLTSLLSSMRMDFYGKVESEKINPIYSQLASIGIKTTANYLEGGKLEINEAELKKAIEEDPQSIEALFNASGTTNGQKGIAQRLYDTVGRTMDILNEKAGKAFSTNNQFTIGKQLNSIDDQIDSLEDRMKALEDRYYRQFTAMEKAIQSANQQSAYIMQNFFN